jgi:hypothetical protein
MQNRPKKHASTKTKPGPKAETLKLDGNWKDNIRKSMPTAKSSKP